MVRNGSFRRNLFLFHVTKTTQEKGLTFPKEIVSKKILVVDDEIDIIFTLKSRLEAHDYEVIAATDGDEGLARAFEHEPDLIILDIVMPKVDGYTFLKELRMNARTKQIPVIVLTGKAKMKDLFDLEGVKDYLTKPYRSEDLLAKINEYLKK